MKSFLDVTGTERAQDIEDAVQGTGLDPIHLLALLNAESTGINPFAERYGVRTREAIRYIEEGKLGPLQDLINEQWTDISFGPSQHIVLYHYFGDRSSDVANVLAVRQHVFDNTRENIFMAARKLAACGPLSRDGSVLGAMVAYNAGSDRRGDPVWLARWSANVDSYERSLAWAEAYRISSEEIEMVVAEFGVIWGNTLDLEKRADLLEELAGPSSEDETKHISLLRLKINEQIAAEARAIGGPIPETDFRKGLEAELAATLLPGQLRTTASQLRQSAFEIRESIIAAKQKLHMD